MELLATCRQKETTRAWPSKALVVSQPDANNIVQGLKIWDLRPRRTNQRGIIAIAERTTGEILAQANLVDIMKITAEVFDRNHDKHLLKREDLPKNLENATEIHAWVLEQVVPEPEPRMAISVRLLMPELG